MIGHIQIIEARKRGSKPSSIFVDVGRKPLSGEDQIVRGILPTVTITADEVDKVHDFRFLTDCTVHVAGEAWTDGVLVIAERIYNAKARHVIVCCIAEDLSIMERYAGGDWIVYAS